MYRELLAVFDAHPGIDKVMIKQNEFTRQDTKAKRRSAYNDAAVVLACAHRDIRSKSRFTARWGTTSKDTKRHAESRVGKTDKYWDTKMADAVNAAWWGLRHP